MQWVALYSQSGTELSKVCKKIDRYPDYIFCDKKRTEIVSDIEVKTEFISHKQILQRIKQLSDNTIITLHGYLRIIDKDSIKFNMFNIHPGDIIKHPQLKGIHPQQKAIDLKLKTTGIIIHRVNEFVDSGDIIKYKKHIIEDNITVEHLTEQLKNISVNAWVELLQDIL